MIKVIYGIVLCIVIGLLAIFTSMYINVGSVSIAIVLGLIIGNTFKPGEIFQKGITYSEKQILSFAIALLGINLNYKILEELGLKSLLIIIIALIITISSSIILGKIFRFDKKFALLLGIGNGVCGSSAIAATEQIIGANEEEVGVSVAIVNFLGTLGIFLLPLVAKVILQLDDVKSGVLIGNTLQAVGQVMAAAFSLNELTGHTATIVKMARILMLTPIIFILLFAFSKNKKKLTNVSNKGKIEFPKFIIGFILFSLIPTFGLLPEEYIKILSLMSHYALVVAMAGIGLKISFGSILRDGKTALLIGSLIFVIQILLSSCLIIALL